jgi:hypothetical protein
MRLASRASVVILALALAGCAGPSAPHPSASASAPPVAASPTASASAASPASSSALVDAGWQQKACEIMALSPTVSEELQSIADASTAADLETLQAHVQTLDVIAREGQRLLSQLPAWAPGDAFTIHLKGAYMNLVAAMELFDEGLTNSDDAKLNAGTAAVSKAGDEIVLAHGALTALQATYPDFVCADASATP